MKARTFQEIYDFCLLDRTYNAYFDIPDDFDCKTKRQYRYYHAPVHNRGITRAGTFIYGQSMKQLDRFLKSQRQDFHIHINSETFEEIDYHGFEGDTIYIVAHIRRKGVRIEFNHPFKNRYRNDNIYFTARSHRSFDRAGLIEEVKAYINKKLLYPVGRYRDLQVEYKIPKEKFVAWYKNYREELQAQYDAEYREMYDRYHPDRATVSMSFEECYTLLEMSGAFYDLGADNELEKDALADEFFQMCNR